METYRFGEFELDLAASQLRHNGMPVKLQRRPFDLLVMLVRRPGRLVPRDEIIAALWPGRVIIDFESGLNTLVRKVRDALGDSPDAPRFVETVPGRGYRFVAPVAEAAEPASVSKQVAAPAARRTTRHVAAVLLALIAGIGAWILYAPEPAGIRIAVLPFENLTGDEGLGYLASGIAEETNHALAQIDLPNLSVIGVVSSIAAADSDRSLQSIARDLDVDFLVLSSLRLDRAKIRVTSRLLRATDGEQVWSASFDRGLTNLLGLQRELSVAIAEQIRQKLSPEVAAAIDRRQTQNPAAYELYLKGRHAWMQFQPDSVSRAISFYRQAVALDPGYALAWAGIAHALITSTVTIDANSQSVRGPAFDALQQALEYGPDLAESQLALASYHLFLESDMVAAETAVRRAVALDPNSAMCHMFLGVVLAELGKHVEARDMLRRARELDPLFPLMFANSAVATLMANEPREALEYATQAIAIDPEFWVGYLHLGSAQFDLGDLDGALQAFTDAEKLSGGNAIRATAGKAAVLAAMGRRDEVREVLDELVLRSAERHVPPYYVAVVQSALGDAEAAFEWLERGLETNDLSCPDLRTDRLLVPLQSDLRFERIEEHCYEFRKAGRVASRGETERQPGGLE